MKYKKIKPYPFWIWFFDFVITFRIFASVLITVRTLLFQLPLFLSCDYKYSFCVRETSHDKIRNLHSIYPPYLHALRLCSLSDFALRCKLAPQHLPDMIRVSRPGILLITLPSDSSSRWTPLCLANGWQLPASIADFHRQVTHHAWRTTE